MSDYNNKKGNLLFITRKLDESDDNVGFAIGWIEEFANNLQGRKLIVLCQELGNISKLKLIENIEVYSLGKELKYSKWRQLFRFHFFMFKNIGRVDGVFSHMIQHYSVLAGPWCILYRKKLYQWYTHKSVNFWLKISSLFVNGFISASRESFCLKTSKPVYVFGHGINLKEFQAIKKETKQLQKFTILSVGRIDPSKNVDLIIDSVEKLLQQYPELENKLILKVIGGPGFKKNSDYFSFIKNKILSINKTNNFEFIGPIPNKDTVNYYQSSDLLINISDTGGLDKVVLEAMACETMVLTSNNTFKNYIPDSLFIQNKNLDEIAEKIYKIYNLDSSLRFSLQKQMYSFVKEKHDLSSLTKKILGLYFK